MNKKRIKGPVGDDVVYDFVTVREVNGHRDETYLRIILFGELLQHEKFSGDNDHREGIYGDAMKFAEKLQLDVEERIRAKGWKKDT